MSYLHISTAPSRELYEQVRTRVDIDELRADGLLLHAASELGDGSVRIVDLYRDAEAVERARERMFATFASAGVAERVHAGPQPEVSETFEVIS